MRGDEESITREVKEQLSAATTGGGFIAFNGSPLASCTLVKNVDTFIESVRKYGRYS